MVHRQLVIPTKATELTNNFLKSGSLNNTEANEELQGAGKSIVAFKIASYELSGVLLGPTLSKTRSNNVDSVCVC